MRFGERVRQLRKERSLTQQKLAERLSVSLSYVSKVENERLNAGDYPSEAFVRKLAEALDADVDELLILTDRVPEAIRRRVIERPEAFRIVAELSDSRLDALLMQLHNARAN
ncbi:helix-turn-helix domain-containing protein [Alienimonas sp. DA493]|uniref:helix-turn-helix domain-containing protein n=1 Tax=Alienimonas sp. DA493 TaxID=3373605 RepID=UPI0037542551